MLAEVEAPRPSAPMEWARGSAAGADIVGGDTAGAEVLG